MGWQGDALDTEIETITYEGKTRFQWTVYDRTHLIKTGISRTRPGASIAAAFAAWRYKQTL
jgi:hypothetical protein